jgi:sugar transferase (PEP-CTERM system associated)
LALLETVLFFLLLHLLVNLRAYYWGADFLGDHADINLLMFVAAVAFLSLASVGMYNREVFFNIQAMISRGIIAYPLIFIVISTFLYLYANVLGTETHTYYVICLVGVTLFYPLTIFVRGIFVEAVNLDVFKRQVLVLGGGSLAGKIGALLGSAHGRHFNVVGFIGFEDNEAGCQLIPVLARDLLERRHALAEFVRENGVDEIVVASDERRGLPVRYLLECKMGGVQVTDFATFWEREAGQIDLESLQPSWLIFSDGFKLDWFRLFVKRTFDVVVSASFLVFTFPITMLTAIAIKLGSPGPVFYRQERVGRGGRRFHVFKFRSMRTDAEEDGVPRWADSEDDRITAVGHFIRKTRIDEIPQVVNVLLGHMSFVGPRPERPFFVESLSEKVPFYQQRHGVKPGITGWAQINYPYGASEEDARAKLAYDLYYVKNGSIFLDFLILVQTVRVILWPEGAR